MTYGTVVWNDSRHGPSTLEEMTTSLSGPIAPAEQRPGSIATHIARGAGGAPIASESDRDRVRTVNAAQLVGAGLIGVAVATTLVTQGQWIPWLNQSLLIACAACNVIWTVVTTRGILIDRLFESPSIPTGHARQPTPPAVWISFVIQLALIAAMFQLIRPATGVTAMWMIVLPMVAYGFVLLPRTAAVALVLISLGLLTRRVVTTWGWGFVPEVLPQYALSILFTLVFTTIAVRTERSRTEVARLAGELRQANRRLSEYAVQAEELATTRERNRMAREIHDTVGHVLTVVNVQLEAARAMLSHDPSSTQDSINKAQELTQQGLRDIRNSVATLRSSPLDDCSLPAALQKLIGESTSDGQTTELLVRGIPRSLPAATELSLYRAGQEGLTNARRHAAAHHVRLILDYGSDRAVKLTIADDGCGTDHPTDGYGLLGLRERAVLLGGSLSVRSSPGEGFELSIEAPT